MPASRFSFSFHRVTAAVILLFIVGLSAAYLTSALSKFQAMAEDSAQLIFRQVSEAGSRQVKSLLEGPKQYLGIESETLQPRAPGSGATFMPTLEQRFISALEKSSAVYAYYVGYDDGSFYQVIGIRDDPHIRAALSAPAGTWHGVRVIAPAGTDSERSEHWRFLDQAGKLLASLDKPSLYDPRGRTWYKIARAIDDLVVVDPYRFASSGEIGLTMAHRLHSDAGVMGADVSIRSLTDSLAKISTTPNSVTTLIDRNQRLIAIGTGVAARPVGDLTPLTPIDETANPNLMGFEDWPVGDNEIVTRIGKVGEDTFVNAQTGFSIAPYATFRVASFAPMSEFSGHLVGARDQMLLISGLLLLFSLPLAFFFARRISHALWKLTHDAERIKELDFSQTRKVESIFHELNTLGEAQDVMKSSLRDKTHSLIATQKKLENLIHTGLELGRERDRMALLKKILFGGRELLNCDAGTLYLVTENRTLRFALRTKQDDLPSFEIPLYDEGGAPIKRYMATWCALHNEPVIVDDVYQETRFDVSGAKQMDHDTHYRTVSMLTVPLAPREGDVIGVLQFLNALDPETGATIPFKPELVPFVTAMAAQAAVALDNFQLLEAQRVLMDALIKLIAGAIDAKSAYTGGHCERVPELAIMLAEAAGRAEDGPLAGFGFKNDDEWREFRIGAWLHDCGKVTTPEYVVDKATKLETIYDRIHEVRMRFEVLLRDAMIEHASAVAAGQDEASANQAFETRRAQLQDDFAFVAECNLGGEFMAPDRIERLQRIAQETWQRHFDDRLGLGHEELKRYAEPAPALPTTERLLADKSQHVIPRTDLTALDSKWHFKVKVPDNLYNHGEIYNLAIGRGTLTEEERYKINEHVIQSLIMLEQLPLPKSLKRVPEYAGTHHETLTGTGYPRQLGENDLTIPMRIMAIADIFEALTASDRPYKKAKTLSEAIKILSFFKKDRHIDGDLFDLFLTSGVYLHYAKKYLRPEQIDAVEIQPYLSKPAPPA